MRGNVVCVVVSLIELKNNSLFIYLRRTYRGYFLAYMKVESSIKFILLFAERTSGIKRGIRKEMINNGAQTTNKYVSFNSYDERLLVVSHPYSSRETN
jgi:hypothetical protein